MLNFVNYGERRILFALGISLLFHVLLLTRFGTVLSTQVAARSSTLEARLMAAPDAPSTPGERSVDEPSELDQASRNMVPHQSTVENKTPVATSASSTRHQVGGVAVENALAPLDQAKKTSQPEQVPGIPLPSMAGRLKRVAMSFETFSGVARKSLGTGSQLYIAESESNFSLSIKQHSNTEDAGQNVPEHLEISGRITPQGLSPVIFERLGAVAERLMALKDVSVTNSLAGSNKLVKGRMTDGILDRQSLLYQFMLKPPGLGGGQLWLSDGINHILYTYRAAGFETFNLPSFGDVRSIKLILTAGDSSETIELWLVPDLHYLPVKMRHTDVKGDVIEQVVTSLDFD